MRSNHSKANILAAGSILLWCFSGICFRKGSEIIQPMTYLSLITAIGVLTAIIIQKLQKKRISRLFKMPLKVIIAGFLGITVYTLFLATAFDLAKPEEIGLINLLNYLWPVWMVTLEILLIKSRVNKKIFIIGMILGFSGLLLTTRISTPLELDNFLPHLLALSGGVFWAFYSVLIKKWKIPEEQSGTAFHFSICALLALVIALFKGEFQLISTVTPEAAFWIIFGGIGPVGIAYYLWELGIKKGSVSFIASLSYFIPIGSSVLIGLVFTESMTPGLIPGSILIAAGAYFVKKALKEKVLN